MAAILLSVLFILSAFHEPITSQSSKSTERHYYCVDINRGSDSTVCIHQEESSDTITCCATLDYTLQWITSMIETSNSTVIIVIHSGNYTLNDNYTIWYTNSISITTSQDGIVNVTCNDGAGLSFINSSNIIIKGLTLNKCGAIQPSTNCDIFNSSFSQPRTLSYHVALYFSFCHNVVITQVHFCTTQGISVALYNSIGKIHISNCIFYKATQYHSKNYGGGGGLQIEFSYCPPGIGNCGQASISTQYSSKAVYYITNNTFIQNFAHRYHDHLNLYRFDSTGPHSYNFGNGAGMSIVLKGKAASNNIMITNCTFANNWAHYGGGFYIAFLDSTSDNNISMTNINVTGNINYDAYVQHGNWDVDATGGGGLVLFQSGKEGRNNVVIKDSEFAGNIGNSGGGLSIQGVSTLNTLDGSLMIYNVTFYNNSAYLGSAIYLYLDNVFHHNPFQPLLNIILNNSLLTGNIPLCLKPGTRHIASLPCTGIIYASNQPLSLAGTVNFTNNQGSSLELHYTTAYILNGSVVNFLNNTTVHGAGLSLYDCSYITINEHTKFLFLNNTAQYGAAVYASHCTSGESQTAALSSNCIFSYHNTTVHPDEWKTNFTFVQNNYQTNDSIIYVKSLVSCYWPKKDSYLIQPENTFSWRPFNCRGNGVPDCSHAVVSGILYMSYNEHNIPNKYPGQTLPLPSLYDGKKHKITQNTELSACVLNDYTTQSDVGWLYKNCDRSRPRCFSFHSKDPISLYYCAKNSTAVVSKSSFTFLTIKSQGKIEVVVRVNFSACQWPYTLDTTHRSYCALEINVFCCSNTSLCNSGSHPCDINALIHPTLSYCVSTIITGNNNNTQERDYIIGRCPISYGNLSNAFKYDSLDQVSPYLCNTSNQRTGMLCGQCKNGHSLAVNSIYFECIDCKGKVWKGWIFLFLLQFLPQTIVVLLIVMFNIKLAVGIVTGYILYCQLLSLQLPGWYYPPYLSLNDGSHVGNDELTFYITSTYSLFNMRFLSFLSFDWSWPVCLSANMSALAAISFWYIVAFYPFLLLAFIGTWVILYDRGIHVVVKATVPLHRRLARFWRYFKIEPSLVQSLVSVYVLSSMELISISTKLLHYTSWQSLNNRELHGKGFFYDASVVYFGWPHAFFGLFALVVLLFLVGLPLFFLLFYQFWWFHSVLNFFNIRYRWCMMVGDVFTGPFKDGSKNRVDFSYVSGLYLLYRVVSMCLFYIVETEYTVYSEIALAFLFAAFIMIFRPFRSTLINFAEFIIFFNLGLMAGLCLAFQGKGRSACIYAIMHIPTLLILLLILVTMYKKLRDYCINKKKNAIVLNDMNIENDDESYKEDFRVPDRILNPGQYNERHVGFLPSQMDLPYLPLEEGGGDKRGTSSCTQFVPSLRSSIRSSDSDYGTGTVASSSSVVIN